MPSVWPNSASILLGLAPTSVHELAETVADALAPIAGADLETIETAFVKTMRTEGFSVGGGVAIPHTEWAELKETLVCLVTLREPLPLRTIDGRPPDLFFFVLSKPDPRDHLLLLAHLARLAQSCTLLNGLRRARTPEEAEKLVRTAEMRHQALQAPATAPSPSHALFVVSIGGEKAVDSLLVDLVDQGFGDGCVLEAQSLREATAREIPLFAGFRDLFGDPGGRRILLLEAPADCSDMVIDTVKRISEEHRAPYARVSVVPIQYEWALPPVIDEETAGGH